MAACLFVNPLSSCRLYTFVDTAHLHGRDPADLARQLCDGGADLLQLRAKGEPLEAVRRLAQALLPVCERAGVGFVLNDFPTLALEVGAPLCHLGQEDFFDAGFTHVSQLSTPHSQLRVGLSTHSPAQAMRALRAAPDYLAIGPVFATGTKPGAAPVTLDFVRWAAAPQNGVALPWFAIGGITLANLDDVLAAGARRVAVVSAILGAPDVSAACRAFRRRLDAAAS